MKISFLNSIDTLTNIDKQENTYKDSTDILSNIDKQKKIHKNFGFN